MRIFPGMKFTVRNIVHSKQIQDALFSAGYTYAYPTLEKYQWLDKPFLFASTDGEIGYVDKSGKGVYDISPYKEHYVSENSIYESYTGEGSTIERPVGQQKPALGLKPRALHDAARLKDLMAAMTRYAEAGIEIPEAWIVELFTVNKGAQTKIVASEIVS